MEASHSIHLSDHIVLCQNVGEALEAPKTIKGASSKEHGLPYDDGTTE